VNEGRKVLSYDLLDLMAEDNLPLGIDTKESTGRISDTEKVKTAVEVAIEHLAIFADLDLGRSFLRNVVITYDNLPVGASGYRKGDLSIFATFGADAKFSGDNATGIAIDDQPVPSGLDPGQNHHPTRRSIPHSIRPESGWLEERAIHPDQLVFDEGNGAS
jgi:hypothetical protein